MYCAAVRRRKALLLRDQVFYFNYGSMFLTGLQTSIGVTHSSSSCPFLCALGITITALASVLHGN